METTKRGDTRSPLAVLVQETAENYVEAQAIDRRRRTDPAFTPERQAQALAALRDDCLRVAALIYQALPAETKNG